MRVTAATCLSSWSQTPLSSNPQGVLRDDVSVSWRMRGGQNKVFGSRKVAATFGGTLEPGEIDVCRRCLNAERRLAP